MKNPIVVDKEILGGTLVLAQTRMPVQILLDYLEGGETIDDFLEGFPLVSQEQVVAFLEIVKEKMIAKLTTAQNDHTV